MIKIDNDNFDHLLESLAVYAKDKEGDWDRYILAEALSSATYPKYKFSEYGRIFLEDEEFLEYYKSIMDPENWHSLDRKFTLNQFLKMVTHLDGDIVECGAYMGASAQLMCRAIEGSNAKVHLFDSFEGLSEPGHSDGDYWQKGSLKAAEKQLHDTLAGFDNYLVYKGWIPERFHEVADKSFRLIHIDVDIYEPTFDSLSFFYPRLQAGGFVLLDDHGFSSCPGAKKAADDFMADKPENIALMSTGQALIQKQ